MPIFSIAYSSQGLSFLALNIESQSPSVLVTSKSFAMTDLYTIAPPSCSVVGVMSNGLSACLTAVLYSFVCAV